MLEKMEIKKKMIDFFARVIGRGIKKFNICIMRSREF